MASLRSRQHSQTQAWKTVLVERALSAAPASTWIDAHHDEFKRRSLISRAAQPDFGVHHGDGHPSTCANSAHESNTSWRVSRVVFLRHREHDEPDLLMGGCKVHRAHELKFN